MSQEQITTNASAATTAHEIILGLTDGEAHAIGFAITHAIGLSKQGPDYGTNQNLLERLYSASAKLERAGRLGTSL